MVAPSKALSSAATLFASKPSPSKTTTFGLAPVPSSPMPIPGSVDTSTFASRPPAGTSVLNSLSPTSLNDSFNKNIPLANPTISTTSDTPMGPTLIWSEKIPEDSKLTNGIYGVTQQDGKISITRCAVIGFPANEESFEWGDDASMINYIKEKMRLQSSSNDVLNKNGVISGKSNDALYTDEPVSTTGLSITHQQLIKELQTSSKYVQ